MAVRVKNGGKFKTISCFYTSYAFQNLTSFFFESSFVSSEFQLVQEIPSLDLSLLLSYTIFSSGLGYSLKNSMFLQLCTAFYL